MPSLALSLHMTGIGSAVSSLVKLRFPALLLHSPCTVIAYDRLRLGSIMSGKTPFSRLAAALACIIIAYDRLWLGSIKSG